MAVGQIPKIVINPAGTGQYLLYGGKKYGFPDPQTFHPYSKLNAYIGIPEGVRATAEEWALPTGTWAGGWASAPTVEQLRQTAERTTEQYARSQRTSYEQALAAIQGGAPVAGVASAAIPTTTTFEDMVKRAQEMLTQMKQPAVASLEAARPEIAAEFARERKAVGTQQQLMEQRYKNLLADISSREERQFGEATKITAGELGKRGIAPGGTFYEQELAGARRPVTEYYAGLTRDIGLSQSEEAATLAQLLGQLTTQETGQYRDLANAIAAIQAATGKESIETAMSQYQLAQQAREAALEREFRQPLISAQAEYYKKAAEQEKAPQMSLEQIWELIG